MNTPREWQPRRSPAGARLAGGATDLALLIAYAAVLVACVLETIAHTPGCFKVWM